MMYLNLIIAKKKKIYLNNALILPNYKTTAAASLTYHLYNITWSTAHRSYKGIFEGYSLL